MLQRETGIESMTVARFLKAHEAVLAPHPTRRCWPKHAPLWAAPRSWSMKRTVQDNLKRAEAAGLSWPLPGDLTDDALEDRLFARAGVR